MYDVEKVNGVKRRNIAMVFIPMFIFICACVFWPKNKEQELGAVGSFSFVPFWNTIIEEQPSPFPTEEQIIEEQPSALSIEEQIKEGDFSCLKESEGKKKEYERIFEIHEELGDMEWKLFDINKDGFEDLIWQEKEARFSKGKRILGIFSCNPDSPQCVIWDTAQMTTGYFWSDADKLVYYYQSYGICSYNRYDYFTVDVNWVQKFEYGLEIYNIYDLGSDPEWQESFEAKWQEKYGEQLKEGISYKKCIGRDPKGIAPDKYIHLSEAEFLEEFYELTGFEFEKDSEITKTFSTSGEGSASLVEENLDSWIGEYAFGESVDATEYTPFMFMDYKIEIYKGLDQQYYANISINGQTTGASGKAKVCGNEKQIELIFQEYLPDHMGGGFSDKEDAVLFRFEKAGDKLYTYWGEITPLRYDNEDSGKIYFEKE